MYCAFGCEYTKSKWASWVYLWNRTSLEGHARERLVIAAACGQGDRRPEGQGEQKMPPPWHLYLSALSYGTQPLLGAH